MIPEKAFEKNDIIISKKSNTNDKNESINKEKISEEINKKYNKKFVCNHGCHHIFKSMKQKLLHHDKLDNLCHIEKINILILLEQFNICINNLIPNEEEREKYKEYILLLKKYKNSKHKMTDQAQFEAILHLK
jgi:hypothetical protein